MKRTLIPLLAFFILFGCIQRESLKGIKQGDPLVLCQTWWKTKPNFIDDMDKDSLKTAIERSIEYLNRLPSDKQFVYGPHTYSSSYLVESMNTFLHIFMNSSSAKDLNKKIRKDFYIYKSAGSDGKGSVFFTGYYEPVIKGSFTQSEEYRYPVYAKPDDLKVLYLEQFHPRFEGERIVYRYENDKIMPYYNRKEIDEGKVLLKKGLELLWVSDPIDLFFMQIQGSGIIGLEEGKTQRVHYAASNGRPYRSIGRQLIDENKIAKEEVSLQSIRDYLRTHPDENNRILNHNESYVFFELVDKGPLGNISVVLTPGRSIATDYRLFPKGGIAFIRVEGQQREHPEETQEWKSFSRFAVNQDTGGAIRGPGRVDLFWGEGREAELAAGSMQHHGEMYFLVKKPSEDPS